MDKVWRDAEMEEGSPGDSNRRYRHFLIFEPSLSCNTASLWSTKGLQRLVVLILKANYKYPPIICLLIQSGGGFVQYVSAECWALSWGEVEARVF